MAKATKMLRLGVLLSGGGRTMVNIQDRIAAGTLPAEIAIVIASRPCKGLDIAQQLAVPAQLVSFKDMPHEEDDDAKGALLATFSSTIDDLLDAAEVDLVCLAGFLSFWRIPDRYLGRVINIHPALLPSFGGKGMYGHHVHEAVLAAGCKVSGCTVHFVNNEYDTGPIILQRCVPVLEGDTPDALAGRVFAEELMAFPEAIALFAQDRLKIEGKVVRILPK
jgi:formyltetrahydrofolate-dependent phosphoribosylglycinamide formyltransferase